MTTPSLNRLRLAPEQLSIYRGEHVFVTNRYGLAQSGRDGLYHQQTRFLSRLALAVNGRPVKPVCANAVDSCSSTAFFLAPAPGGAAAGPPGEDPDHAGGEIVEKGIEVQVNGYAGGGLHLDVIVLNRTLRAATVTLDWQLDADFADLDEVGEEKRRQTAPVRRRWDPSPAGGTLRFDYDHPRLTHATVLTLAAPPEAFVSAQDAGDRLRVVLALEPARETLLELDVAPVFLGVPCHPWFGRDGVLTAHHPDPHLADAFTATCATVETGTAMVAHAWNRAAADLCSMHALRGKGDERYTPMAGLPKYTALFGRDTLVAGLQSVLLTPATLGGSLQQVGAWTARTYDDGHDAQPGKVLHQHQQSPLSLLGINPFLHYYGDVSASGLFVLGAATHYAHTGDRDAFMAIRDATFATLDWMDRDGDFDRDGFYEYRTLAGDKGMKNQGWKDSEQAILYEDGSFVPNPIAVVEVQGLFYAAKQAMAGALAMLGEQDRADALTAQAADLRARFNDAFWMPELDYFAIALDGNKTRVRSVASDPGTCLGYGIIEPAKAVAVCERLMRPDLFTGWGVRTLSSRHPAYNPLAYHLGTVWPVSTANIAYGLRRHGFNEAFLTVARALFEAAGLFDYDRLPEVFGGHQRDKRHPHPGIYPEACSPQAWSATAVMHVLRGFTGFRPLAPLDTMVLDPCLPDWLPDLTLRNVQVGRRRVSFALHRDASGFVEHEMLEGAEGLRVVRPAPRPAGEDRMGAGIAALG